MRHDLKNVLPAKDDPDGPVEGIDADRVADAMARLGQSPGMARSWETYKNWKPTFTKATPKQPVVSAAGRGRGRSRSG